MSIKEHFDQISEKYDQQRRMFIPCYEDFYHLPLTVASFEGTTPEILDIGSGTGLFASLFLQKYPQAKLTLIDLSDKMLEVAEERFQGNDRVRFVVADYTKYQFRGQYDIIISALSIHHLSPQDKQKLYQKCYDLLRDGGIFINADQVLSPSPQIEKLFSDLWHQAVISSDLSEEELQKAYERVRYDDPSSLADQIKWLQEAGFDQVDCLYKYYHFCVLYAKR